MAGLAEAVAGRAVVLQTRAAVAEVVARELLRRAVRDAARAGRFREIEATATALEDAAVAHAQDVLRGKP